MDRSEIEALVADEIVALIEDADPPVPPERVTGVARLGDDLGLSSLDLAELVTVLELELDADPFRELVPITSVRTVGDLVQAYERVLSGEAPAADGVDSAVAEAEARAQKRKARRGGA